ncbi:MAG: helix-turn-helix domain-containing protein [Longimicrobiales bacterium]
MDVSNGDLTLTSTQAADLLDVHPSTVKRWCNDGDLGYSTTQGGHRRIHLRDVSDFARSKGIRTILTPFHPYEPHVWTALREAEDDGSFRRLHSLAMGWIHRGRLRRVARLYDALAQSRNVSLCRFCDEAVRGLMADVGRAWFEGRLRAGEEHMVSQAMTEVLLRLRDRNERERDPSAPTQGVALVGSAEGNQHHLGALSVRLLLERLGWEVLFLGPDVPLEDFGMIQRNRGADLVCVSMPPPAAVGDINRVVGVLRASYDVSRPFALALGGAVPAAVEASVLDGPFVNVGIFQGCDSFQRALGEDWVGGSGRRVAS